MRVTKDFHGLRVFGFAALLITLTALGPESHAQTVPIPTDPKEVDIDDVFGFGACPEELNKPLPAGICNPQKWKPIDGIFPFPPSNLPLPSASLPYQPLPADPSSGAAPSNPQPADPGGARYLGCVADGRVNETQACKATQNCVCLSTVTVPARNELACIVDNAVMHTCKIGTIQLAEIVVCKKDALCYRQSGGNCGDADYEYGSTEVPLSCKGCQHVSWVLDPKRQCYVRLMEFDCMEDNVKIVPKKSVHFQCGYSGPENPGQDGGFYIPDPIGCFPQAPGGACTLGTCDFCKTEDSHNGCRPVSPPDCGSDPFGHNSGGTGRQCGFKYGSPEPPFIDPNNVGGTIDRPECPR